MSTACYLHPALAATATCEDCRCGLCERCTHLALGRTWCEPCLSARVGTETPPPPPVTETATPHHHATAPALIKRRWLAGLLSGLLPGLGNVYTGFVVRGVAQFAAWWLVFAVARGSSAGFFIELVALLGFIHLWVWSIVDAVGRARALNRRGYGVTAEEARTISLGPVNEEQVRFIGVGLLIVGTLLFAQEVGGTLLQLFRFSLPLALIGCGAWILHRAKLKTERERQAFDATETLA